MYSCRWTVSLDVLHCDSWRLLSCLAAMSLSSYQGEKGHMGKLLVVEGACLSSNLLRSLLSDRPVLVESHLDVWQLAYVTSQLIVIDLPCRLRYWITCLTLSGFVSSNMLGIWHVLYQVHIIQDVAQSGGGWICWYIQIYIKITWPDYKMVGVSVALPGGK